MQHLGIKFKLIILFILFKVIPLVLVSFIAIQGALKLEEYFDENTKTLFTQNKKLIESTASNAIEDSIEALDKTSQTSIEKLGVALANSVAEFLYERDKDILFLASIDISQKNIDSFYKNKNKDVLVHEDYIYDEISSQWVSSAPPKVNSSRDTTSALFEDNEKEFHFVDPLYLRTKNIPIYKEITFFDTKGEEIFKKSSINNQKVNISKKENTYCKAEDYFKQVKNLKAGEIYVSDVIGAYVPSKIIGNFTRQKTSKRGLEFKPELHGYAGKENPKGKRFEGIVRFVTPIFKGNQKLGYISLALDHRHIMEFTDNFNPVNPNIKQNIANAGAGNYAFMWDYEGKNISHPRDYFIMGYDPKTGKRVPGWISARIEQEFKNSNYNDLNLFLERYPKFYEQTLQEKPNLEQLFQKGEVGLDCRYLNFAPQCQGWMQLTQNGGYGSFIIFWSNVWKLTTAATIPYYTGKYGDTKRGFGFVTIGANVDEFHEAANETKKHIDTIISSQNKKLEKTLNDNSANISEFISSIINELSIVTAAMIIVVILLAIWMSNYITSKIEKLIVGTQHFSNNDLDYRIEVTAKDEIGKLENAFNEMAHKIQTEIETNKEKEAIIIQKNKMAELGDMMSAILHQWKQPLNAITMSTSSLKLLLHIEKKLDEKTLDNNINVIEEQAMHMAQTMDDFSNFFRPSEMQSYKASQMIQSVDRILDGFYRSMNIKVNYIYNDDFTTKGYPNEMMQVIINIINNARDAIRDNDSKIRDIDVVIDKDKDFGTITISDLAGGIPDDIIAKIFKPYFTTKTDGKGTGIGLYMSKTIINKAEGDIEVKNYMKMIDNVKYQGAMFIVKLKID